MISSILVEASLLIGNDIGAVDRSSTEEHFLNSVISLLGSFSAEELDSVSTELEALKELGRLGDICGERNVTRLTDRVLDSIFYGEVQ